MIGSKGDIVRFSNHFNKRVLGDLAGRLRGKRVFVRADFNVSDPETGSIKSDARLREAVPTLDFLHREGAITIIGSHNERPKELLKKMLARGMGIEEAKDLVRKRLTLHPAASVLSNILGREVKFLSSSNPSNPINFELAPSIRKISNGEAAMLENFRFYAGEEAGERSLAEQIWLVTGAQVFVQEAFGAVHRSHASITGLPQVIRENGGQAVAGFLLQTEATYLGKLLSNPPRPYVAFVGGAKVRDKIGVIEELLKKADRVIIGGAMLYPFYLASGHKAGAEPLPSEKRKPGELQQEMQTVTDLLSFQPTKLVLPESVTAEKTLKEKPGEVLPREINIFSFTENQKLAIPPDFTIRDVYPFGLEALVTRRVINEVGNPATVVWNGPFGQIEKVPFGEGTFMLLDIFARFRRRNQDLFLLAGGGDTEKSIKLAQEAVGGIKIGAVFDHISTGGGAMLEFLEGEELPGIAVLDNRY